MFTFAASSVKYSDVHLDQKFFNNVSGYCSRFVTFKSTIGLVPLTILTPSGLQKRPQIAIIDCLKSKPQVIVTEAYQQSKPCSRPWT